VGLGFFQKVGNGGGGDDDSNNSSSVLYLFTCCAKTAKDQLQGQHEYRTATETNKHENKSKPIEVVCI
jgi:hypothetical protein